MTDGDLQKLQEWQASPEGNAYMSVRGLEFAIDDLTALSQSREGVQFIRRNLADICAAQMRLADLVADVRPGLSEGSELEVSHG